VREDFLLLANISVWPKNIDYTSKMSINARFLNVDLKYLATTGLNWIHPKLKSNINSKAFLLLSTSEMKIVDSRVSVLLYKEANGCFLQWEES